MKYYMSRLGEDLGSIAKKYGVVSWKYLYELNKEEIGDNPDLLKPGTRLKIPLWDSTGGDEMIAEKGGDPFAYTGGVRYRYPWVPMSVSVFSGDEGDVSAMEEIQYDSSKELTEAEYGKMLLENKADGNSEEKQSEDEDIEEMAIDEEKIGRKLLECEEETELLITISGSNQEVYKGTIMRGDEFEMLLPDTPKLDIGIKGFLIEINGKAHCHPDDSRQPN